MQIKRKVNDPLSSQSARLLNFNKMDDDGIISDNQGNKNSAASVKIILRKLTGSKPSALLTYSETPYSTPDLF